MRKRITAVIIAAAMTMGLVACGESPEADHLTSTTEATITTEDNTITVTAAPKEEDTEEASIDGATLHAGDNLAGSYPDSNTYVNDFFGFTVKLDGGNWKFYDSEGVANAAGLETSTIDNFWDGNISAYDNEISYCAIGYNGQTGTNIIVTYFNPAKYNMSDLTAYDYLKLSADSMEGSEYDNATFLGDSTYAKLIPPVDEEKGYYQEMYAKDKDGLILMITFTVMNGEDINDVISFFEAN